MRKIEIKCRMYFSLADSVEFHALHEASRMIIRVSYNSGQIECTLDKLGSPRKITKNLTTLSEEEYFQEMCVWDNELDIELILAVQRYGYEKLYEYENDSLSWNVELEY